MKSIYKVFSQGLLVILLMICSFIMQSNNVKGQTVLNNNLLLFGTGSENSVNTTGNLQQPFYYNSTLALWRKLTYSSYPLDNTFAIGGVGTSEWNLNGTMVANPTISGQVIDLSGYIVSTSPNGYGTIISTGTVTIAGSTMGIQHKYELGPTSSYIKVTTKITNSSGSPVSNVRFWIGTRDDYVGGTDSPLKEKGNLVDGAFVMLTNAADRALALRISTPTEGILFYTNSSKGNNIINGCCSWTNVTNQNPATSVITVTNDGSYGFYVRMNDLAAGVSDEFTWYYAAGKLADLENIIAEVAAASGAVTDITYTTATFKATTSVAGTGYYVVVPRNATAPTAPEIKSGVNYGSVTVVASGSDAMLANVEKLFYLTGLTAGTSYDLYFVSEDATPAFSSVAKVQFATPAYTNPPDPTSITASVNPVCNGSSTQLTANGAVGTVYWYTGSCGGTPATPATGNPITVTPASTTTYYARNYNNAQYSTGCASLSVTVYPILTAGISGGTTPICYNNAPGTFTATGGGGTGSYSYLWYKNGSTTGVTTATYAPGNLTSSSTFYCAITSGSCGTVNTGTTSITVYNNFTAGSILTTGETICYNADPVLIGNSLVASGGNEAITYQWQSSLSAGFTSPSDISNDNVSFDPPAGLKVTTWYRRQAKDGICNTAWNTSGGVWKVTVDEIPPIAVAKNITIYLNASGNAAISGADINNGSTDNCTIASLGASKTAFSCADMGTNTVVLTVTDTKGNTATANSVVTVLDAIAPTAIAKNITITLDPYGVASITAASIDNGSYDNCAFTLVASKTSFTCVNLGSNTVTLTATDGSGNSSTAASTVTVVEGTALLPPWVQCLIGNSSGTAIYTPCTGNGMFTLTSKGYSLSNSDVQESVNQDITGNGSIIARVCLISGSGWAGVQIREGCAPGAKKVLLKTQFQTLIRSDIRQSTGGATITTQVMRQGIKWLKLVRTGNRFDAYTSVDGIAWRGAFSTILAMSNTVQIGIFTESINNTTTTTAKFDKVVITSTTLAKSVEVKDFMATEEKQIEIYPNPANEYVNILIPDNDEKVKISIFSAAGKMEYSEITDQNQTQLNIRNLKAGIYILHFESNGRIETKRLVVY